jgi:hypothetical protein
MLWLVLVLPVAKIELNLDLQYLAFYNPILPHGFAMGSIHYAINLTHRRAVGHKRTGH